MFLVTYLSPGGKVGDTLKGTAICEKSRFRTSKVLLGGDVNCSTVGKTLAFTTVTFTNGKGQLAARGSHTK